MSKKELERPLTLRERLRSFFSRLGPSGEPQAQPQKLATDRVKEVLFRKEPEAVLRCLGEPGNVLIAAKLLLQEDYVFASGWALSFAARHGIDISVAVPYLDELLSHREMNARSYAARALASHHLNNADRDKLRVRMRSSGDESVTRETAEVFLSEIGRGNLGAVQIILESLSDPEKEVRTFSAYVLDNAPGYCDKASREILRCALARYKQERRIVHLDAYRFIDDALRAIDIQG